MSDSQCSPPAPVPLVVPRSPDASLDVFVVANRFDNLWNSRARAVAPDRIEWQCRTWGSGTGRGCREDVAIFDVVRLAFGLVSWTDHDGRDELVVEVPLSQAAHILSVILQLDESEPADWPWSGEDVENAVALAAEVLGVTEAVVTSNAELMESLGLA